MRFLVDKDIGDLGTTQLGTMFSPWAIHLWALNVRGQDLEPSASGHVSHCTNEETKKIPKLEESLTYGPE